jgi:TnpA family transposase
MTMRQTDRNRLLSDAERSSLIAIPEDRDALVRLYTFEADDLALIAGRRDDANRLGVALQFALLRHPGVTLAGWLQSGYGFPDALVSYLAETLDIPGTALSAYAARSQTMTDHGRELAQVLGLRLAVRGDIPLMIAAAAEAARGTDKGLPIASGVIAALRANRILLPALSTIERAGLAGRAKARKAAMLALVAPLSPAQRATIDGLILKDETLGLSRLSWLKTLPDAAKPDHVRMLLDRLTVVRGLDLPMEGAGAIHPDRAHKFAREARLSPAYMIERYTPLRRRAMLVAYLAEAEAQLTDAALAMADKLIGSLFTRAKARQAKRYAASAKDVARLMRLFERTIDALAEAVTADADPIAALDADIGWATLLRARPEVKAIAASTVEDTLTIAADRYQTIRKFAPALLEALAFKAGKGDARTIAAIETLRLLHRSGRREVPPDAPMPFRKEWRKTVIGPDGRIIRRLYETAVLAHLRNKLRSGDVYVERSSAYRRFDSYLMPGAAAAPIVKELGLPTRADGWLAERGQELDDRLRRFERRLARGQLEGVALQDGRLLISPIKAAPSPEAESLALRLEAMMPRIRITELLHEVARQTGFLDAFTNLRTGAAAPHDNALLAAILADATNLGLSRMAAASQGVTRDQLIWTRDAYIREENYRAALAMLIDAQHGLPIASTWGDGSTSSSDGQFFRGGKRVAPGGEVNARYGTDPGFSFYTHVSDQHGPFHVTVLSAATHEAPYVLDGLLHHGTSLSIKEHYTDTGGATDHVFALCSLLGFRFCPRLRDFPDRRLIPIAHPSTYPSLQSLFGKRVQTDVIGAHWEDILRLAASLHSGHAMPSAMLRKLAAFERRNQLDLALQQVGRIERTLFMLDWLENPSLRRRCQAGLNKSEQRHALTQAICTFRQGRIIDRSHEAQLYRASGLNLVIAAIVYWNATYMADAIGHLASIGDAVPENLIAHTSPVGWEHIAFSGDFLWDRAARTTARKALILPA